MRQHVRVLPILLVNTSILTRSPPGLSAWKRSKPRLTNLWRAHKRDNPVSCAALDTSEAFRDLLTRHYFESRSPPYVTFRNGLGGNSSGSSNCRS